MTTDLEKAAYFESVMENMIKMAREHDVPLTALVVRYSRRMQENGLPEYYTIEVRQ